MKNLKNLNGVKTLSKNEQKTINGGGGPITCSFSAHPETDKCCAFENGYWANICNRLSGF